MADQYGNLSPEDYAQQQQINRQQKMAEMLMSQNQQPQGQMVSGRYVAPSFFQNLQPIANMLTGAYLAKQGDTKAQALAENLRNRGAEEINKFSELMKTNPQDAYKFAATAYTPELRQTGLKQMLPEDITLGEGQKRIRISPTGEKKVLAEGDSKVHVVGTSIVDANGNVKYTGPEKPTQIDTGTEIQFIEPTTGKIVYRTPKHHVFAPHAPQLVETANGPMLVNPYTGNATPIMANGKTLAPKLNPEQTKDIVGINQQRSTIQGAIDAVKENPKAFTFGRGLAQNLPAGETIAGRYESPAATQARAYVFNNVSAVIKERAGTAQSASEMQRINSFMPSTKDNDKQIIAKLNGFNQYLNDLEKGTRIPTTQINTSNPVKTQPNTPITIKSDDDYNALPSGAEFIDPKGVKRRKP